MNTDELIAQNGELHRRLEEAEATVQAIRDGAVDAFVVQEAHGHRIYTLEGADRPYRILIERMQQGAATLSADGAVVYCNVSLATLLGIPHEKLIGAPLGGFVSVNSLALYGTLFREGQTLTSQGELELQRSDGVLIPVIVTFSALRDSSAAVGVLVTDITAQKQQAELAAAHEVLKETNRLKDDFLMTLSHELRTPLNAILGWAHMLRDDTLSPDAQRKALDAVARNANAQARLIEDLLDLSRIVSGKLQIKTETVDLGSVVVAAVETVLLAAKAKRITLTAAIDQETEILVQGDAARLQQVVWNLLSNSVKFTPPDGCIDVKLRHRDVTALVEVKDDGLGIERNFLPHVFQPFRQADGTTMRRYSGLGLGLAIVQHLTEAHGGTVSADSAGDGQGATFVVQLPLHAVRRRTVPGPGASEKIAEAGAATETTRTSLEGLHHLE